MHKLIKKGMAFQTQKMFPEAEQCFQMAAKDKATQKIALLKLALLAKTELNYDLALQKLDAFLEMYPNHLIAQLSRAHIAGLKSSLFDYRNTVNEIVNHLPNRQFLSAEAGKKLLISIQYASSGTRRLDHLKTLATCIDQTIKTQETVNPELLIVQSEVYFALGAYDAFTQSVKELIKQYPKHKIVKQLSKMADKYTNPNFPDYSQPKVFGIGLSRTGTHSLNKALNLLNYHSIHWRNPHTQNVISDDDFLFFDGFTDISVSYRFEALYKTFPNAQFIFTTRNEQSWVRSISVHYENSRSISRPDQLKSNDQTQRFDGSLGKIEGNLYAIHASWENAFKKFENRVNTFFSDKPTDKFLKLAITEGEGWDKLCSFLRKPCPAIPFPNANKGPVHRNGE